MDALPTFLFSWLGGRLISCDLWMQILVADELIFFLDGLRWHVGVSLQCWCSEIFILPVAGDFCALR